MSKQLNNMPKLFSGKVVELTLNQVKRVEKVLLANGLSGYTKQLLTWDDPLNDNDYPKELSINGKVMVDVNKTVNFIKQHNLVQAIKDEFSGVDLVDWMENNMINRNDVKTW